MLLYVAFSGRWESCIMPEIENGVLTFEIRNDQPVELTDLTSALTALGHQYSRYLAAQDYRFTKQESKLYVKQIRSGSIIAELAGYAATHHKEVAEFAKSGASVVGFAKQLVGAIKSLKDGGKTATQLPQKDLRDLAKIVDVTASDPKGSLHIEAREHGTVNINVTLNSVEANAVQNQATRLIEAQKLPTETTFPRVLLYWHTASLGNSNTGVIEKVTDKPLPVTIDNDEWKKQMLAGKTNPLLIGFIVDVEVLYVRGEPKVYRVINFHEAITE